MGDLGRNLGEKIGSFLPSHAYHCLSLPVPIFYRIKELQQRRGFAVMRGMASKAKGRWFDSSQPHQ